jgi:hypothetical protein
MSNEYDDFLSTKAQSHIASGFDSDCSDFSLFPFQRATVEWALALGRAAIFADTGLGKTFMQLVWAHKVAAHTNGAVLLLAPLAVVRQTEREAEKFGIPGVRVIHGAADVDGPGIYVINYDSMHKVEPAAFSGVVLDESSILKNVQGRTRRKLCADYASTPYRLACTATPSPNDHTELGNHSEFLGVMDEAIMRARWFKNDLGDTVQPWRLKRHAEGDFWRWVASWARCIGKPSDMGPYSDDGYNLPPLDIIRHNVEVDISTDRGDGMLFRVPDLSATSIHAEKRRTAEDRAWKVADLVRAEPGESWVVWCETNYEQDALMDVLAGSLDVRGSQKPEEKARDLLRFTDDGGVIVTKPKIAGMGLNWQHCARMAFVGGSYSYEGFYQSVRRCYRFGQARGVHVHVVMAKTETAMWHAIHRKSAQHAKMKEKMYAASKMAAVRHTNTTAYQPNHSARIPAWLYTETKR